MMTEFPRLMTRLGFERIEIDAPMPIGLGPCRGCYRDAGTAGRLFDMGRKETFRHTVIIRTRDLETQG